MKHLFLVIFVVLCVASVVVHQSYPDMSSPVPVLYWVTDANPARKKQVAAFHEWLVKEGHVTAEGRPVAELRIDVANNSGDKKVIQGVSGVAGDIWDTYGGAPAINYYQAIGLLEDVTEAAKKLGFDPSYTYPALLPEITIDGRQYQFPCNVASAQLWVNKETFRRYGQPLPPARWTLEEFERLGKQFVDAANPSGQRRKVFYVPLLDLPPLHRSLGLARYNETLSRCTFDDPRMVRCLELYHKWTYEDHILPSLAEQKSFESASGYGGPTFQLFQSGAYAMICSGRWALIELRKFGPMELGAVELPHGGFPNAGLFTRGAVVYALGKHKPLATLFQAYLASEEYNMLIVRDADSLPPNPKYALTEEFMRPAEHPNEWECHVVFHRAAMELAVGNDVSPFVLDNVATRHFNQAFEGLMADQLGAKAAAEQMAQRINKEMERSLQEDPALRPRYEEAVAMQKKIEAARAAGERVPRAWIRNPFYQRYYEAQGWLAEER